MQAIKFENVHGGSWTLEQVAGGPDVWQLRTDARLHGVYRQRHAVHSEEHGRWLAGKLNLVEVE